MFEWCIVNDECFAVVTVSCQDCGSSTTECVSGDWFGEVGEVDLADLKQEPDDVRRVFYPIFSLYFVVKEKLYW